MVVHPELIAVRQPPSAEESGFEDCQDLDAIRQRMHEIARHKAEQIRQLLNDEEADLFERPRTLIIAADTTVVVEGPGGRPLVLGQPPESEDWREIVRNWFLDHYAGKTHLAATAVYVVTPDGRSAQKIVETRVRFRSDVSRWLNWYLLTGEPRGKAGGYALQGAGSVFVEEVLGSSSNVVGLPLEALLELFAEISLR